MQTQSVIIDSNTDSVPVLLQPKKNACKMLACGLTKVNEMIADGTLETVDIGRHVRIKTESIYRAAGLNTKKVRA